MPKVVYYPVFLSQYELIDQGFWRGYSYGMVVFSRNDYLKLPGFDMTKIGWGEEDVELYQQFLTQKTMSIIRKRIITFAGLVKHFRYHTIERSRDPDLFHPFHSKDCSNLIAKQHYDCVQTKFSHKANIGTLYDYYRHNKTRFP